ncbi:MAG: AMIN domain-containing protein, partial [Herbaspirillum sp.]
MISFNRQKKNIGVRMGKLLQYVVMIGLFGIGGSALAQQNTIESVSANQQGANIIVRVSMKNPVTKAPLGFAITNPARIALDFADTNNATGQTRQDINLGDVRNVNIVEASKRSRLVFNLNRPLSYAAVVDGKTVVVTISSSGEVAKPVNAAGVPLPAAASAPAVHNQAIRDIDFRRGTNGEGRVVIDLPNNQMGVDVRQQGNTIVV